jgi:hypothetical protein
LKKNNKVLPLRESMKALNLIRKGEKSPMQRLLWQEQIYS